MRPEPPADVKSVHKSTGSKASRPAPLTRALAEEIAIAALGHIAAEPERLDRFLALTGLDPHDLRRAAAQPGFLRAVLDHLAGHEPDYLAFAAACDVEPQRVEAARLLLGD